MARDVTKDSVQISVSSLDLVKRLLDTIESGDSLELDKLPFSLAKAEIDIIHSNYFKDEN